MVHICSIIIMYICMSVHFSNVYKIFYLFVSGKAEISLARLSTYHLLPQLSIVTARTLLNLQIIHTKSGLLKISRSHQPHIAHIILRILFILRSYDIVVFRTVVYGAHKLNVCHRLVHCERRTIEIRYNYSTCAASVL